MKWRFPARHAAQKRRWRRDYPDVEAVNALKEEIMKYRLYLTSLGYGCYRGRWPHTIRAGDLLLVNWPGQPPVLGWVSGTQGKLVFHGFAWQVWPLSRLTGYEVRAI